MIKALIIIAILIGLLDYALIVASSTADKDAHEAYERWKERKKKRKEIEHLCEMAERLGETDHE